MMARPPAALVPLAASSTFFNADAAACCVLAHARKPTPAAYIIQGLGTYANPFQSTLKLPECSVES